MRQQAKDAIKNMSKGCQSALGQLWNLYDGSSSLIAKVDNDTFYDARTEVVKNLPMTTWGYTSTITTGDYIKSQGDLQGFVSEDDGPRAGNQIILTASFFSHTDSQDTLLIHEVLHTYTGLNDDKLVAKLGLSGIDGDSSTVISTYINLGCDLDLTKKAFK
jgi:hypothetical protein